MTPAALTAPPPLPVARRRHDFADWLSPILVKELRQGLQSHMFVVVFVLVQCAMVLMVGLGLLAADEQGGSGPVFEGFFAFCVWLPLLVLMPARGLGAIGEEIRAQTLDLVQLTRLNAFRIVWGKWLALVAQTFLLATAMLPYAVLRYYFGQVEVMNELVTFCLLLVASMVFTAAAVCVSSAHVALRVVVLMLILPGLMIYGLGYVSWYMAGAFFSRSSMVQTGAHLLWLLSAAALYTFFFLEVGASRIAPAAENYSARKRLLVLVLSAVLGGAGLCATREVFSAVAITVVPMVVFVVIEALCEESAQLPGLYRIFAVGGWFGRLAGRLLYPGWATGTLFALLVAVLVTAGLIGTLQRYSFGDSTSTMAALMAVPMAFFALISPLPIMRLFSRFKYRFRLYAGVQLFSLILCLVAQIVASPGNSHEEALNFIIPVPTAAFVSLWAHHDSHDVVYWTLRVAPFADLVLLIWLSVPLLRQFGFIRKMERLALVKEEIPSTP